jgi:ribosomal protein L7/L12
MTQEQIIEAVKNMTVLELNDLVKAIEEEFGVTAAAPVAAVGAVGAVAEEKTEFDVILTGAGDQKITKTARLTTTERQKTSTPIKIYTKSNTNTT